MTGGAPAAGVEPVVVHVVVGPEQHGVVRHGALIARAGRDQLIRLAEPAAAPDLGGADVVHVPYTDRLFGGRAQESADAFEAMVAPWLAAGRTLSVTLHDLPADDTEWDRRRAAAYRRVLAGATGVVVNSWRELELVQRLLPAPGPLRSLRCVPLPLEPVLSGGAPASRPDEPAPAADVVLLGFLFPDRGYEHTIAELPAGVDLVAVGRPSAGHDDLPAALAELAAASGHAMTTTGFVPDPKLGAVLASAGVPVAPNRRVAASASINTWIAHGRRPLIPDSPYSRELALRTPGSVRIYDADTPGALRAEITAALADPRRTWLPADAVTAPSVPQVAERYRVHFAGCAAPTVIMVGDRYLVPDNRWDLLDAIEPPAPPSVSVVVPHFNAQSELDLVLTALGLQTHPRSRLQVVAADDGSTVRPSIAALSGIEGIVVGQDRDGFRAAAARNLGAAAADGDVLIFLDGDTVPEPDYLTRLVRLPALAPDVLAVGRRRHADLAGWTTEQVAAWLTGVGPAPDLLDEPAWLRDAYADTQNLLRVDHRSYRSVISAVLATSRDLFTELGGFSEEFRAYGGEDWELAHRAYVAGAVFAHVPDAVAWHDGPDWAGRNGADATAAKNDETLALARMLPDPEARGGGQWRLPAVAVELGFGGVAAVLATARAAFSGDTDAAVWVDHPDAITVVRRLDDSRIRVGPVPPHVRARAQAVLRLETPARVTGLSRLLRWSDQAGPLTLPTGRLVPGRTHARPRRWAERLRVDRPEVDPDLLATRLFGGRDLPGPPPSAPVDLAHELKYVYASTRAPSAGTWVSRS
ncbi:MAG: glycosyltransferase [Propionibacteriaceae bacterium]